MTQTQEVRVPDIGDYENIPVIDVLVGVGDTVSAEQTLITLESDKASMDVPAPQAGVVETLDVALGDEVSEGTLILTMTTADDTGDATPAVDTTPAEPEPNSLDGNASLTETIEVRVPDIGDFSDIPVIEIMVSPGDTVKTDDSLVTLESDKASMDVPSPEDGTIAEVSVAVGDHLSEGDLILYLETTADPAAMTASEDSPPAAESTPSPQPVVSAPAPTSPQPVPAKPRPAPTAGLSTTPKPAARISHATPSVRRFARELGVDLGGVVGTGRKGRVTAEDVRRYVKEALSGERRESGFGVPEMPVIDFSKFGGVQVQPLSRIKKLSGSNLHRAWLNVPHVTHHDEADITELEAFRKEQSEPAKRDGVRLTLLAFIMKACVGALKAHPTFNASLDPDGENLILKHYYHLGVAVDTVDGLVVPVIRDVDKKSVMALAQELGEVSEKARSKKLSPADLQGACFTISSLGGIGGTAFTPIVNAPEVAILGVSRSAWKPVYDGSGFVPRLMLPLSLSYDHRVIDGAAAARFARFLGEHLTDIRKLVL